MYHTPGLPCYISIRPDADLHHPAFRVCPTFYTWVSLSNAPKRKNENENNCATQGGLSVSALRVRLGQDRLRDVLESRIARVSEGHPIPERIVSQPTFKGCLQPIDISGQILRS